jgi:hypothetical protein
MNTPAEDMPRDFGIRYILWVCWSNAITILMTLQGVFAAVLLVAENDTSKDPLLPHTWVRWIVLGNAILTGVVAQIKRSNPPGPPPTKTPA